MRHRPSPVLLFGAVVAANLVVFILSAQFLFLGPVHHHWIFPFEAFLLGTQYVFFATRGWAPAQAATLALLALLILVGILRWETIHTCVEHCGPKALGALALALACLALGAFARKKG